LSLGAPLALALALAAPTPPLACPKGLAHRGAPPPEAFEEWCEGKDAYGNGLREGPARTWYDDGGAWVEQSFHEGRPDGAFLERHRNGKPAREGAYALGRKVGSWRVWYASGVLEEQSEWRDGAAHGKFAAYWPTGGLRTEGRHCGGVQCGRWRTYDADGKVVGEVDYGEQRLVP
jgi:antitoxin component YwqK of YwqJK toxin-antitoxin module